MPKGLARQWVIKQALFPQVVDVENERRGIRRDYSDWSSVKLLDSALFASWREIKKYQPVFDLTQIRNIQKGLKDQKEYFCRYDLALFRAFLAWLFIPCLGNEPF